MALCIGRNSLEEVDDFVQINSHLSDPKRTRISKHRIKTPLPPHLRPASEYGFGYKGNFTKFVHSDGLTLVRSTASD